jgi:hypothetical protein
VCLTALSRMRAVIEQEDVEQGVIVASLGGGTLVLVIRPQGQGAAELAASWRARGFGRDRRTLTRFLEAVQALITTA